jgi:tetratricopeptide (TPR) repeat protein
LDRKTKSAALVLSLGCGLLVALAHADAEGPATLEAGLERYRSGDIDGAAAIWQRALEAQGEDAPAVLHINAALVALAQGDVAIAHQQAELARPKAGAALAPACDFVMAHVAFEQAKAGLRILRGPEAGPADFDRVLGLASVAREFWRRSAIERSDWPQARRNAERAHLLFEALQNRRDELAGERKTLEIPKVRILPGQGEGKQPKPQKQKTDEERSDDPLRKAPESVQAVLDQLREREQRRRQRRQEARDRQTGERDW